MITVFGITLTLAQILMILPKIIEIVKIGMAIVDEVNSQGGNSDSAFAMIGKQITGAFADVAMVPHPHPMTRAEEELWFEHASRIE